MLSRFPKSQKYAFKLRPYLSLVFLVLTFLNVQGLHAKVSHFFKTSDWSIALPLLVNCQTRLSRAFLPVEWIRFDNLPENFLVEFGKKAREINTRLNKIPDSKNKNLSLEKESCRLFDELYREGRPLVEARGLPWIGNHVELLETIPKELRRSFTPFDPVFRESSEVGKKIAADMALIAKDNIVATSADLEKKAIVFYVSAGNQSVLTPAFRTSFQILSDKRTLAIKSQKIPGNLIISADQKIYKNNLKGSFLNNEYSETSPLGPYPPPTKLWLDESGKSHFEGDGHDHK